MNIYLLAFALLPSCFLCEVYFKDKFDSLDGWVVSDWKQDTSEAGKMELSAGQFTHDVNDKGLKTMEDAKFYAISKKMDKVFDNKDKTLVLQVSVKHEQKIDCGGGYIKLFPPSIDPKKMEGSTPYAIMFGPDICGYSTKKVHCIITHKDENLLIEKEVKCPDDKYTHVYTFIINPDNTYEVRIDGEKKQSGSLKEDWPIEKPKEISDPDAKKPEDWVDEAMMDDPEDKKPDNWDDIPENIVDEDAEKPEDWDDEEDGEWEAPVIPNPDYKGEWRAKRIDNPDYKGSWEAPMIPNPEWESAGDDVYQRGEMGYIGFEIWQVKSGTIFDNIIVTDSVEEAEAFMKETFFPEEEKADDEKKEAEKKAKEEAEAEQESDDEEDDEESTGGDTDEAADMADLEDDKEEL